MSITVAYTKEQRLEWKVVSSEHKWPSRILFWDVFAPTPDEVKLLEDSIAITVPSEQDLGMSEVVRPFYHADQVYYMTITVIYQHESSEYIESAPLAFILSGDSLIMLSHVKLSPLQIFFERTRRDLGIYHDPDLLLTTIIDVLINNVAKTMEEAGNELDVLLKVLFAKEKNLVSTTKASPRKYYDEVIAKIGMIGNVISKTRESLVSINRLILYYDQIEEHKDASQIDVRREQRVRLRHLSREIHSLAEYASFLSQRNSFLIDATLGMLSVEQNMIIKMFTVAAAVLMPPTLIASVYGMNFQKMPELTWEFGYPFAILLIIVSALIPYAFFKKKGWL